MFKLNNSHFYKENNFGFESIKAEEEKTFLVLKKRDTKVVDISVKILKGSGWWERFKNLFTKKYAVTNLTVNNKERIAFVKMSSILQNTGLTAEENKNLKSLIQNNPSHKPLEMLLIDAEKVDINDLINKKHGKYYEIIKIPDTSKFKMPNFQSMLEPQRKKWYAENFKTCLVNEIQKKGLNFQNIDEPPSFRFYYDKDNENSVFSLEHQSYYSHELEVKVWLDKTSDTYYIMASKVGLNEQTIERLKQELTSS